MQPKLIFTAAMVLALAACGGGGGGGGSVPNPNPNPNPTTPPDGNIPAIASVAGSSAFVAANNQHTLYFLSSDNATGGGCTGGCTAVWPPYMASAGSTNFSNMTVITRSDGTGQQWAYQGHPLYTYSGDSGPVQANGEGIPAPPSGTWHVSRPASTGGGGGGNGGGGGGGY